jgi:hypothetical protein
VKVNLKDLNMHFNTFNRGGTITSLNSGMMALRLQLTMTDIFSRFKVLLYLAKGGAHAFDVIQFMRVRLNAQSL